MSNLPPILIESIPTKKVAEIWYLGVLITSDLMWSNHISNIASKAWKVVGAIYRKFYRDMSTPALFKLYLSLVRPVLEYCSPLWDPHLIIKGHNTPRKSSKVCIKELSHQVEVFSANGYPKSLVSGVLHRPTDSHHQKIQLIRRPSYSSCHMSKV